MNLVESEYSPFGQVLGEAEIPTGGERDWEAERKRDVWRRSAMLRELGWTLDDLVLVQTHGFPKAVGHVMKAWGSDGDLEPIYSRNQVAKWREDLEPFLALVAAMRGRTR